MIRIIGAWIILLLCSNTRAACQTRSTDGQAKILGMDSSSYAAFCKGLQPYHKQLGIAFRDSASSPQDKNMRIRQILQARKAYVEQHLTIDQRNRLLAWEHNSLNGPSSQHQRLLANWQDSWTKKGVKQINAKTVSSLDTPGKQ